MDFLIHSLPLHGCRDESWWIGRIAASPWSSCLPSRCPAPRCPGRRGTLGGPRRPAPRRRPVRSTDKSGGNFWSIRWLVSSGIIRYPYETRWADKRVRWDSWWFHVKPFTDFFTCFEDIPRLHGFSIATGCWLCGDLWAAQTVKTCGFHRHGGTPIAGL